MISTVIAYRFAKGPPGLVEVVMIYAPQDRTKEEKMIAVKKLLGDGRYYCSLLVYSRLPGFGELSMLSAFQNLVLLRMHQSCETIAKTKRLSITFPALPTNGTSLLPLALHILFSRLESASPCLAHRGSWCQ